MPAIPSLVFISSDDPLDPEALYAIATAYAASGLLISNHGHNHEQIAFTFPAVVCSSFALELFLKFFLTVDAVQRGESKVSFGHAIPTLWAKVSAPHKTVVAGMYGHSKRSPESSGVERRLEQFEEVLGSLGNQPFVQWRYAHELQGLQLMSHAAISLAVDTLWRAAEHVAMQEEERWSARRVRTRRNQ